MSKQRDSIARWGIYGLLFGALFPVIGWVVATRGAIGISEAHVEQPVLWIVNLAPFVLALAAMWIGHEHSKVLAALRETDQKVHERTAELRVSNEQITAHMKAKDQFLAVVSHELRTPLTVVSGFAQELVDEDVSLSAAEEQELLEVIADQSRELSFIIEDLLLTAKADIGAVTLVPAVHDLAEEVNLVFAGCVCTQAERDSFELDLDPAVAEVDSTRVRQIVRNLLTNAVRYGGPERRVVTRTDGDTVTICVCDNGGGIPEEDRDRVFEPFQSSDKVLAVAESVGLGLTVSRKLARMMGGELSYSYDLGVSTFRLSFPAAKVQGEDKDSSGTTGESLAVPAAS
jgi:signal transduction histidine kinase